MARRTFDVVDIIEILVHWHAGRSNSASVSAGLGNYVSVHSEVPDGRAGHRDSARVERTKHRPVEVLAEWPESRSTHRQRT